MSHARISSCTLMGTRPIRVEVETHVGAGLPTVQLVGLADTEVREARERGRFDLPIALALLVACGHLKPEALAGHVFAGELALNGELRPMRAALPMVLACASQPWGLKWVLPGVCAEEARLVPGVKIYQALHLLDVVAHFANEQAPAPGWRELPHLAVPTACDTGLDLSDVRGHGVAKRALELAAAGGHNLLMAGPPGSGKSMLAQRLPGLLPKASGHEALQIAALQSLAGLDVRSKWGQRPWRAPHHSATAAAMVGGGSPPRPGEVSLAHLGVLFLDELPEFRRQALECLREPLENQQITISRAAWQVELEADFQLIAAMNPCPCGFLGAAERRCRCTPDQVLRYQGRLSGPFLDRIDLHIEVPLIPAHEVLRAPPGEHSALVQARCQQARQRARDRQGCCNARLTAAQLQDLPWSNEAQQTLQQAAQRWGLSARAIHRCWRVAWTIADLGQASRVEQPHVFEALQYRHRNAAPAG
jgi:magnesium chelatase family protein